jgi:metallopeptidase MepB
LFHELGHAIHHLVERTKYARGQSRDFGEIPSNMLEHFVWIPEVMQRLSQHYSTIPFFQLAAENTNRDARQPGAIMPLELARAVARTRTLNQASGLLNFVQGAMFDLAIYTPKTHQDAINMDTTAIWDDTKRKYLICKHAEGSPGQASVSLFFRGCDAAYFKYLM